MLIVKQFFNNILRSFCLFFFLGLIAIASCSSEENILREKLLFTISINDIYDDKDSLFAQEEIFLDDGTNKNSRRQSQQRTKPGIAIRTNFVKKNLSHFKDEHHYYFSKENFVYHRKGQPIIHLISKNKKLSYTNQFFVNIKKLFITGNSLVGLMYNDEANYFFIMQAKLFKKKISLSAPIYYYDIRWQQDNINLDDNNAINNNESSKKEDKVAQKSLDSVEQQSETKTSKQTGQTMILKPINHRPQVVAVDLDNKNDNLLIAFDNYVVVELTKNSTINYYSIPSVRKERNYINFIFAGKPQLMYGVELIGKEDAYLGVRIHTLNYVKNKVVYTSAFSSKSQYFFDVEKKRHVIMINYQKPAFNKAFFYYYPINNFSTYQKKNFPNHKFKLVENFESEGSHLQGMVFSKKFIYFYQWH